MNKSISPSRTYVAVCSTWDSKGYFFKKFTLPDLKPILGEDQNDSQIATWFYLNALDGVSVIEGCFSAEDFAKVSNVQVERIQQSHIDTIPTKTVAPYDPILAGRVGVISDGMVIFDEDPSAHFAEDIMG